MKNLLTITDLSKETISHIFDLSRRYELPTNQLQWRDIVFAFEKPSLRTKIATEVAINQLWGNVIHIEPNVFYGGKVFSTEDESQLNAGREALKDTVKNLWEWCDGVFARVFSHQTLLDIDSYSSLKTVNALCDQHHPMQAITDLYTIQEVYGNAKVSVAFVGDSNNVAFSLAEILLKFGHEVRIASPERYSFQWERRKHLEELAKTNGATLFLTDDSIAGVKWANVVYTDAFVSMGEESVYAEKIECFSNFQVNDELMSAATNGAHFMHCLPAHRSVEVTDSVIDGKNSLVYLQARNRMVTARGVFLALFGS